MLNAKNKVIAITGASSGIGEASAKLLAQNGAKVVRGARRTQKLENIVEAIRVQGGTAEYKALDVTDREDMKAFIHFAKDKFGRVDVIFNNAGVMPLSPMNALKVEEWDKMIDVNIHGVLNGIASGLPIMEAQGGGQFINTASIGAHLVVPTGPFIALRNMPFGQFQKDYAKNRRIFALPPFLRVLLRRNWV